MRAAPAITLLAALEVALIVGGCAGRGPVVPPGVTLVEPEEPTPSPELVEEAQRRLRIRGLYEGLLDGELGAQTRIALVRLQRQTGLPTTGRLDWATATALGLNLPGVQQPDLAVPAHPAELKALPSAAELLATERREALPQPPPEALAGPRADAARILARASRAAVDTLVEAEAWMDEEGELGRAQRVVGEVEARLASARAEAFRLLVDARRAGNWAPLPASIIIRLEQELAKRSLLLAEPNGIVDPDDEAAIRWVERAMGLEPTGLPSLRLLDALGIDPAPLFEE